jgi:hypothetical protein
MGAKMQTSVRALILAFSICNHHTPQPLANPKWMGILLINLVALGRFTFFFSSFRYLHAEEIVRFTHVAMFVSCPFVDGASFCEGFSDTFV